jgi:hypothetical protein
MPDQTHLKPHCSLSKAANALAHALAGQLSQQINNSLLAQHKFLFGLGQHLHPAGTVIYCLETPTCTCVIIIIKLPN